MAGKNEIVAGIRLDGGAAFRKEITSINKSISAQKSELELVTAQYEGQANSLEALTAKDRVLNNILSEQQKKVEATKNALKNAEAAYTKHASSVEKLQTAYNEQEQETQKANKVYTEAAQKLEKMTQEGKNSESEIEKQKEAVAQLKEELDKQNTALDQAKTDLGKGTEAYQKIGNQVNDWKAKLNTAETQVIKANNAVAENAKYLEEAENAADGCATSIDQFGKEVKDAGTDMESASEKASTFGDMLKANLTSEAILGGVQAVADKAKEAAEYVVDVGSSFEAAMSEVAAISGATGSQLEALTNKAKELGSSTQFSASEAASALTNMSLAGWSVDESLAGIDGVLQLAAASGMSLADASQAVTDNISSFKLEASDATQIADMMAFAQANSSTTAAELAQSYKNCAANMSAAGQDIETTTSMLESLANNGLRGSEAGTELTAMMRDLTSKMKDGKIAIGDASVEVMDSSGNFRDMTDILKDVENATDGMGDAQKQAALLTTFTADSIKGLNMLLSTGADEVAGYEEQLRNCSGAASDMAGVMNDNLKGAMTELGSATEGLGIAVYQQISGPLTSAVDLMTTAVSGLTEAIDPPKTKMQEFIDEVFAANSQLEAALQNGETSVKSAEIGADRIASLGAELLELANVEDKSLEQRYRMREVVAELGESIPEVAAAYDVEKDSLSMTNEQLTLAISNTRELMVAQALQAAKQETVNALLKAQVEHDNMEEIIAGQEKMVESYEDAFQKLDDLQKRFHAGYGETNNDLFGDYLEEARGIAEEVGIFVDENTNTFDEFRSAITNSLSETNTSLEANRKELETSEETIRQGKEEIEKYGEAAENLTESLGKSRERIEELPQGIKNLGDAFLQERLKAEEFKGVLKDTADTAEQAAPVYRQGLPGAFAKSEEGSKTLADALADLGDAAEETTETGKSAAELFQDSQEEAFNNVLDLYDSFRDEAENSLKFDFLGEDFDGGYDATVETMLESSRKQIEGLQNYEKNLNTVKDHLGKEISPQFLSYLESMGTDAANMLQHIAITFQQDNGSELVKEWSDNYTSYMDNQDRIAEVLSGDKMALEAGLQELGSSETDWQGLQDTMDSAVETLKSSGTEISDAAVDAFSDAIETAKEMGVQIPEGLEEGIASGEIDLEGAAASLNGAIQGQLEGLLEIAEERGADIPKNIKKGIENGNVDPETAFSELMSSLSDLSGQMENKADEAGNSFTRKLAEKKPEAKNTGEELSDSAASGVEAGAERFATAGEESGQNYVGGIEGKVGSANSAGTSLGQAGADGADSAQADFETAGRNAAEGYAQGIRNGQDAVINAATAMVQKGHEAANKAQDSHSPSKKYEKSGKWAGEGYAKGVEGTTSTVEKSVEKVVKSGYNAAKKAFSAADMSKITAKVNAAFDVSRTKTTGSGTNAKTTTKDAETYYKEIYTAASQYLKNLEVVQNVSAAQEVQYWKTVKTSLQEGTQGWYNAEKDLKAAQKKIKTETSDHYDKMVTRAEKYVDRQKTLNSMSSRDEADYWQKKRKQLEKDGGKYTDAWYSITKKITSAQSSAKSDRKEYYDKMVTDMESYISKRKLLGKMDEAGEAERWRQLLAELEDHGKKYSSRWLTVYENLKNAKKAAQDKIISDAEIYTKRQKLLNKMNTQQELEYWQSILKQVKKGSDAWYTAYETIKNLKKEIKKDTKEAADTAKEKAEKTLSTRASVQDKMLSSYKTYYKVSEKAELDYWDAARRQFKAGTDERIAADQKCLDAKQAYYDKLAECDQDYYDKCKDVNEKLKDNIQDLMDTYHESVQSRKEDILSAMNGFEAFNSTGYDMATLQHNMDTQVAGLALWEEQLGGLEEKLKDFSGGEDFIKELREMGPDAAASIYSLNNATTEELTTFFNSWKQKQDLANSQALKENETLREETNTKIEKLRTDAEKELEDAKKTWDKTRKEIMEPMSADLAELVKKCRNAAEDAVAGLLSGLKTAASNKATKTAVTKAATTVADGLGTLTKQGKIIGKDTLDGILEGLKNSKKIDSATSDLANEIAKSIKKKFGIHSPSKLMQEEVGPYIPSGIGEGIKDNTKAALAATDKMSEDILREAQAGLEGQQEKLKAYAESLNLAGGVERLNSLLETPLTQQTNVTVNNTGLLESFTALMATVENAVEKLENLQVVMDKGAVVGQIKDSMSQALAYDQVRRNRGRY